MKLSRFVLPIGLLAIGAVARIAPADSIIDERLAEADAQLQAIVDLADNRRTFENTVLAIDDAVSGVNIDTNMAQFMPYVSSDADEREAGGLAEEAWSEWMIKLGKNEDLYRAVQAYADTNPKLEGEQARLLEHILRDYRRSGMALPADERKKLTEIQVELTKMEIEFDGNIRDDATAVWLTVDELDGMSDEFVMGLERYGDLCVVGMDYPTVEPIWTHCRNETTRKKVWMAYKRRGGLKNVRLLEKMLTMRSEIAHMLGYENTVDYKTETRMAKSAEAVRQFYAKLRPLVRKKAQLDYDEFLAVKREFSGNPDARLYPWDFSFVENLIKKNTYAVDSEVVREYFPLDAVMEGVFGITQSLFGLEYRDITDRARAEGRPLWHEDVVMYEVWDKNSGEMLGEFYIDLHPRPNKYNHAAQWSLVDRKVWQDGTESRPLAALVCNFTKPTADKPSLMRHSEVVTFFHEFGHCLHTILTEAEIGGFAGANTERDFVEAPSQMLENWVWDVDVLRSFTRHYETGEPLPDDLLDAMLAARFVGSGMLAEHQFYYGLMDFTLHSDPTGEVDTIVVSEDLYEDIELYGRIPGVWYHASFGHYTGYEAGYYGYQWSLAFACDMFQRFKELGMLDPDAGKYYREKILSRGGTVDGMDMVIDYLGREPDMSAYLKHLGLDPEESDSPQASAQ